MICQKRMLLFLVFIGLFLCQVSVGIGVFQTNVDYSTEITTDSIDILPDLPGKVECNCGNFSTSCEIREGRKICTCKEGYAQGLDGYCKECDCGLWSKSCDFSATDAKICTCNIGYLQKEGNCTECSCGSKGSCHFENGNKICECNDGYKEVNGFCQVCDCGSNGRCSFEQVSGYVRKECYCDDGYAEFGGYCRGCSCGANGNCTLNYKGKKICKCEFGYGPSSGTCEPCGCNPVDKCLFDKTSQRCTCPKGYEDVQGLCKDINECLTPDVCPASMNCIDKPGSYDCVCKEGYEKISDNLISKGDECIDIDECITLATPCHYENTVCVNTPGSYRCDCKKGYYPLLTFDPKIPTRYNDCLEKSEVNIPGIVAGCLCGALIIGTLMWLWNERMKSLRGLKNTIR